MIYKPKSNFQNHPFHLVSPSPWPLYTSISLFILTTSIVLFMHNFQLFEYLIFVNIINVIYSMGLWFRDIISEGTYLGNHTYSVQRGINIGVGLFIISEVFFFLAIFWAFFHSAISPSVELGTQWPPIGIEGVNPFELPLLNTVWSAINNINVAVWVQIPLYILSLSNNLIFYLLPGVISYILWKPQLIKSYSTINIEDDKEFYKWFSGFTDAEGNFLIITLPIGFNFKFSIGLHIDDLPVLNHIKDKLGFGIVYAYKTNCYYNVTRKEDILKIISIFDIYTLNSSKRLDYLDLKKAFFLYNNRTKLSKELINQILNLKNNMNTKRTNFELLQVKISKSWLLGFIEGDGSFSLNRANLYPIFSINLTESQLPLLIEIKKYLENNLGFDAYSKQKLNSSSIIAIGKTKGVNNSKPFVTLIIINIHVLNNYFLPFFNECEFISKKGLDFNDFKIISKAIYIGAHRVKHIKDLIIKLSYTMNNYRLSTFLGKVESINLSEINEIIKAKATIEYLNDGLQIDIETKKLINNRSSSSIYKIIKSSGEILIKPNLAESAKELGIGFNTLKRQFDNQGQSLEYKGNKIKRIGVFKNKK
jgi:Cytochrome c oxidase subunit III/LAGLIDADG endonuclease